MMPRKSIPEPNGGHPLRNVMRLVTAAAGVQGAALLALPLLQRWCYGPGDFADFALYSQWAGLFGAVATVRMDLAVVKHDQDRMARAAMANGLRALGVTALLSGLAMLCLHLGGSHMGRLSGLWFWLPLGVVGLGLGNLATAWLTRENRFGLVARHRGWGGVSGEALRFAFSGLAGTGLIAGRIAGQWLTAGLALRSMNGLTAADHPSHEERRTAWVLDRDYVRYTTPANLLAMGANALLILYLFEAAPKDTVGQVGAAAAYLTVAAGLLIRGVNDVFFRLLNDIADDQLMAVYLRWALPLLVIASLGVFALHWIPDFWVVSLLGERWADLLPVMCILSTWMVPWVAASSLSGIFPHLGRQSWSLALDVLHLVLVAGWLAWFATSQPPIVPGDWTILKQYALVQGSFYLIALVAGVIACRRAQ
jgi:hypothetical protein